MSDLATKTCVPCSGTAPRASAEEIARFRQHVPEWTISDENDGNRLTRTFAFDDFVSALAFTNRVGAVAEEQGHHPVLLTTWGKVTVTWWTHAIDGLHENDFIMAARTDETYADR